MPDRSAGRRPVSAPLRVEAPAKLNLDLRVVGRREDGFHELDSTFVLLELADRLLLMPGSSGLRVEDLALGPAVPLDGSNLAWRGLEAGLDGSTHLACLALEKRIPVAAGLGGGSSDAAAAWRLGRSWRGRAERPSPGELLELAAIGADVPFFAAGLAAARVSGIGERVEPIEPLRREVVLVHPPFGLATGDVFAELRPDEWGSAPNDLEAPARRLRPELDDVAARVRAAGIEPRMTGAGSTFYALVDDAERADAAAATLVRHGLHITRTRTRIDAARIEPLDDPTDEDQEDR